jgi:hypothetical protein
MEPKSEHATEADRLQAAIIALRTEVSNMQHQIDSDRRESKSPRTVLFAWGKVFGTAVVAVFLGGMGFMQYQNELVTREDFDPVAERLTTLEGSTSRVNTRLGNLETGVNFVKTSLDGLSDEMRGFGANIEKLVAGQEKTEKYAIQERYCTRLLGDYTKQLTEYTARIRRKKPDYSEELEECRIGVKPRD